MVHRRLELFTKDTKTPNHVCTKKVVLFTAIVKGALFYVFKEDRVKINSNIDDYKKDFDKDCVGGVICINALGEVDFLDQVNSKKIKDVHLLDMYYDENGENESVEIILVRVDHTKAHTANYFTVVIDSVIKICIKGGFLLINEDKMIF